ncbi:MAG: hypothetical protein ACRC2M_21195 [Planktothrix sp.]
MKTPASIQNFPCPSCGAPMEFNPTGGKLKCNYCGSMEAIPETGAGVQERSYNDSLDWDSTPVAGLSETALEVKCTGCGANILFEPSSVAKNCPFCNTALITQPQEANPIVIPEGIIPFKITGKEARNEIQKWIKSRWFAPSALKYLAQQEKIHGIYLPFWTYDANTTSDYRGERGDYYYVTETYRVTVTNSEGKQQEEERTREVRHTRWCPASGQVNRWFDDVLVAATKSVDTAYLNGLEPWDLQQSLKPYNSSYLAGFEAQRPQIGLKDGFEQAKHIMGGQIHRDVCCNIGGDEQKVDHISTRYEDIAFKPILLPVWLCSYHYRNQKYQVLVNARTGEIQGDRPYSQLKIAASMIAGMVTATAIILAFTVDWSQIKIPRFLQYQPTENTQ